MKINLFILLIIYFINFDSFGNSELQSDRIAIKQWLDIEKKIERKESEWIKDKKAINDLINILSDEVTMLESNLEKIRENSSSLDIKKIEILSNKDLLIENSTIVQNEINSFEEEIFELYKLFPAPLQKKIDPLYSRMSNSDNASLSERMQNVIGILSQADKFNSIITVESSLEEIGESTEEVTTLYIGLGRAYFVNSRGDYSGYLKPGSLGWEKVVKNELAQNIKNAIYIYNNPQEAKYIPLPVEF